MELTHSDSSLMHGGDHFCFVSGLPHEGRNTVLYISISKSAWLTTQKSNHLFNYYRIALMRTVRTPWLVMTAEKFFYVPMVRMVGDGLALFQKIHTGTWVHSWSTCTKALSTFGKSSILSCSCWLTSCAFQRGVFPSITISTSTK